MERAKLPNKIQKFNLRLVRFFLLAYLLVFPFGQLARLPVDFLEPEGRVYGGDVLMGLAVGIWVISKRQSRREGGQGLTKPILAFAGAAALSWLVNRSRLTSDEALIASLYLLRWLVYAGVYFVVREYRQASSWRMKRTRIKAGFSPLLLPDLLILAGGLTAVFGLLQYLWFPDLRVWLKVRGWDPHYYRAFGTFFDPGYLGMVMVLTLILLVSQEAENRSRRSVSRSLLLVICYLSLVLTYSRSSYLAFLVGMGMIAWKLRRPRFYVKTLLVFTATLLLLPRPGGEGVRLEREVTIEARIRNWKQALVIAKDHPILGVGFNAYRYAQRDYGFLEKTEWQKSHAGAGADSSLLFVLATTGVIGLGAYLWLLENIIGQSYSEFISGSRRRGLAALASLSALLVHSFFLNSLFYPWIMAWLWILLGLTDPGEESKLETVAMN